MYRNYFVVVVILFGVSLVSARPFKSELATQCTAPIPTKLCYIPAKR